MPGFSPGGPGPRPRASRAHRAMPGSHPTPPRARAPQMFALKHLVLLTLLHAVVGVPPRQHPLVAEHAAKAGRLYDDHDEEKQNHDDEGTSLEGLKKKIAALEAKQGTGRRRLGRRGAFPLPFPIITGAPN